VETTFKLLYEETNNEVKLNNHLKQDMTAVRKKKNLRGCGRIQGSYFKIQDPQRSVNLCTCWNVSYVQSLGNDSHQCRHLTKWTILQYHL